MPSKLASAGSPAADVVHHNFVVERSGSAGRMLLVEAYWCIATCLVLTDERLEDGFSVYEEHCWTRLHAWSRRSRSRYGSWHGSEVFESTVDDRRSCDGQLRGMILILFFSQGDF